MVNLIIIIYLKIVDQIQLLENYNCYIKKKLGKKYNLKWNKFLNFIKNESKRIRLKLTSNTDVNIEYNSKYSKFGKNKYNDIVFGKNIIKEKTKVKKSVKPLKLFFIKIKN